MSHPFDDMRWKLRRAKLHSNAVKAIADAFFHSQFYTTPFKQEGKDRVVLRFADVKPMPLDYGLTLGEMAYQARSCLDHLLMLLCRPKNEGEEKKVQFPLVQSRRDFIDRTRNMMPGALPGVRTVVERFQPYHRRKYPKNSSLSRLHDICNWDKHRSIAITLVSLEHSYFTVTILEGDAPIERRQEFRGTLKSGAEIARFYMGQGTKETKVKVDPVFTFLPVFSERMPKSIRGRPCLYTVTEAAHFIETEVIPAFERFV